MNRIRHPSSRRIGRGRGGFTLLEVLIAMTLMAIVLPVVMKGISLSLTLSGDARRRSEAATLARMKLDELAVTSAWNGGQTQGDFGDTWPGYTWQATMETWATDSNLVELTVEVVWQSNMKTRQVHMSTLVVSESSE